MLKGWSHSERNRNYTIYIPLIVHTPHKRQTEIRGFLSRGQNWHETWGQLSRQQNRTDKTSEHWEWTQPQKSLSPV